MIVVNLGRNISSKLTRLSVGVSSNSSCSNKHSRMLEKALYLSSGTLTALVLGSEPPVGAGSFEPARSLTKTMGIGIALPANYRLCLSRGLLKGFSIGRHQGGANSFFRMKNQL